MVKSKLGKAVRKKNEKGNWEIKIKINDLPSKDFRELKPKLDRFIADYFNPPVNAEKVGSVEET